MSDSSRLPQVLAVSGDPGGASALAPVVEFLRQTGRAQIEARAYRQACAVWARRGLEFSALDEQAEPVLPDAMQLLLTSTSVNDVNLEKQFTAAARARGITSVAVLDFWSNYRPRFGAEGSGFPDRIAIMDAQAREEMLAEGFEAERLIITGQPAFDELLTWSESWTAERRHSARAEMGAGEEDLLVVFASQPFSTLCRPGAEIFPSPGYDERVVAALLVQALEKIAAESQRRIVLAIRPHPREDAANLRHLRSDRFPIHIGNEGDSREAVVAADLVVGMNSALLVEACYLGCLVVSLQPNLKLEDTLPTNRRGFSRPAYTEAEVLPALREMLLDESARRAMRQKLAQFRPSGDATQRVAELVCSLLPRDTISTHS